MTREHKLALIVGFALVLIVGIAISDHFSKARVARPGPGNELTAGSPREFGAQSEGLATPLGPAPAPQVGNKPSPGTISAHDVARPPAPVPAVPAHAPAEITMAGKDGAKPAGEILKDFEPVGSDRRAVVELVKQEKPVTKGKLLTHEVKARDTLYKIASSVYGDASLWKALADYNKGRVGAGASLKLGTTLQIPPKDVLLGEAVLAPEAPGAKPPPAAPAGTPSKPATATKDAPETAVAAATVPAKKSKFTTYTVKPGEDLSTIAKRLLGSAKRMQEIVELNSDVLDDADTLAAGVSLKIPTK